MSFELNEISDSEHFEQIFKEYFKALVYFSIKITGDSESSKDLVHNIFIHIWENNRELIREENPKVKAYLFTSVRNRSYNLVRDRKNVQTIEPGDDLPEFENPDTDDADNSEVMDSVNAAIAGLPEKTREVFKLSRFEGLKYGEIAEQLDISVKTVEAQMSRALRHLRKELAEFMIILITLIINGIIK